MRGRAEHSLSASTSPPPPSSSGGEGNGLGVDEIGVDVVTDRGVTGRMNGTIEREDCTEEKQSHKVAVLHKIKHTCDRSLDVRGRSS